MFTKTNMLGSFAGSNGLWCLYSGQNFVCKVPTIVIQINESFEPSYGAECNYFANGFIPSTHSSPDPVHPHDGHWQNDKCKWQRNEPLEIWKLRRWEVNWLSLVWRFLRSKHFNVVSSFTYWGQSITSYWEGSLSCWSGEACVASLKVTFNGV